MTATITERVAMARHAAAELITWGEWADGRPTATATDVATKTDAMYGQYLTKPITDAEAEAGLRLALEQKNLTA
ncbi:hypothetical protein [Streptomyces sp. enrichment culture]|uniref:hypothetical protein n=1 Tax=Streptomyces sp. enrichment culture TaxID=1795815 RepID=UPI003F546856